MREWHCYDAPIFIRYMQMGLWIFRRAKLCKIDKNTLRKHFRNKNTHMSLVHSRKCARRCYIRRCFLCINNYFCWRCGRCRFEVVFNCCSLGCYPYWIYYDFIVRYFDARFEFECVALFLHIHYNSPELFCVKAEIASYQHLVHVLKINKYA